MKKPVIHSDVVESIGPFDVYVGARSDEDYPVYVVINRKTSVCEFSHEVLGVVYEWCDHYAEKLSERGRMEGQKVLEFPQLKPVN